MRETTFLSTKSKGTTAFLYAVIVMVIVVGGVTALNPIVDSIDATKLTGWPLRIVLGLQWLLDGTVLATLSGFAWSLLGYIRQRIADESYMQYNLQKVYDTYLRFEGLVLLLSLGFGPAIGAAIAAVVMAIRSALDGIKAGKRP